MESVVASLGDEGPAESRVLRAFTVKLLLQVNRRGDKIH